MMVVTQQDFQREHRPNGSDIYCCHFPRGKICIEPADGGFNITLYTQSATPDDVVYFPYIFEEPGMRRDIFDWPRSSEEWKLALELANQLVVAWQLGFNTNQ